MMNFFEKEDFTCTVHVLDNLGIISGTLADMCRRYADETTTPEGIAPRMHIRGTELWTWGVSGNNPALVATFKTDEEAKHALLLCWRMDLFAFRVFDCLETAKRALRHELEQIRESYVEAVEDAESVFEDTQGTDEERRHFADLCRAREDLEHWDASALGQSLAILKGAQS